MPATTASLERTRRRNASRHKPLGLERCPSAPTNGSPTGAVASAAGSVTTSPSPQTDAGVEQWVNQVDHQIHHRHGQPQEQHGAENDGIVSPRDAFDEVATDAGDLID